LFISKTTNKSEIGTINTWETTNNKPPEPLKLSETLRSQKIFFDSDY
jgi:hypothetical protein